MVLSAADTLLIVKNKHINIPIRIILFSFLKMFDYEDLPIIDRKVLEEQITLLYAAIRLLNDVERALVLLFLEDLPYRDIAETLGISEVNARVKMNRVKIKLKEIMSKLEQ